MYLEHKYIGNRDNISADADKMIVTSAIEMAKDINKKKVIVAEDTDILVLLTTLISSDIEVYLLEPARQIKAE